MKNVQTVERAFTMLELLSDNDTMTLKEITDTVGLNKTTVYRILQSLIKYGYVKKLKTGKYSLSLKAFKVGNRAIQNMEFLPIAKRHMSKLANEINQIIHLVMEDSNEILYLDKYTPNDFDKHMRYSKIGKTSPMYCTAAGKAILAQYDKDEFDRYWNSVAVTKYTSRTITDYDLLLDNLKRVQSNGYATEFEEYELDLFCVGTAFYDTNKDILGAISVSLPLSEQSQKDYYVEKLVACGKGIISDLIEMKDKIKKGTNVK